jgi:hypothetical protein
MTVVIRQEVVVKLARLCSCNNLELWLEYFRSDSRSGVKIAAGKKRLPSERFRLLLGPQIFLVNWYLEYILRLQRLGGEFDHSRLSRNEIKNEWKYTSNRHVCPRDLDKDYFTLFCPGLRSVFFSLSKRT